MASPPSEKQTVRVNIFNRQYALRSSGDPAELERVAAQLDDLMLALAAKAPNADPTHIAVLACLHLADKLTTLEREMETLRRSVDQASEKCRGMIEELIAAVETDV